MSQERSPTRSRPEAFLCRGEGLTMRCPSQCIPCDRLAKTIETVDVHKLGIRFNFTDGSWEVMDAKDAAEHLWNVVSMLQTAALSERGSNGQWACPLRLDTQCCRTVRAADRCERCPCAS